MSETCSCGHDETRHFFGHDQCLVDDCICTKFDSVDGEDHYECSLCWFSFDTKAELNQHVEMENAVSWSIDQLDDQVPSTYEATA